MKKNYTRKQIQEAINYWQKKLVKMNENNSVKQYSCQEFYDELKKLDPKMFIMMGVYGDDFGPRYVEKIGAREADPPFTGGLAAFISDTVYVNSQYRDYSPKLTVEKALEQISKFNNKFRELTVYTFVSGIGAVGGRWEALDGISVKGNKVFLSFGLNTWKKPDKMK